MKEYIFQLGDALYNEETGKAVFQPIVVGELIRCKDCRWGREVCGNIECSADLNLLHEYHGYEWFCPNGERREG